MSIVFDHTTFWYGDSSGHHAIRDISLVLPLHQTIGVVGKTGSGKSTLVDHISAAITPCQGRVLINDMDTRNKRLQPTIRTLVGHVGQFPEHQLFADTVYEDIAFGPRNLGLSESQIERVINDTCRLLHIDLDKLGEKNPLDLSGGQQRRVALAGILAMQPQILILDEPMAGLDPQGRRLIKEWTVGLKQSAITIIIVTHSMEDAAELTDTLVVMKNGQVATCGKTKEIMGDVDLLSRLDLAPPRCVTFAQDLLNTAQNFPLEPCVHEYLKRRLSPLPTTLDTLEEALSDIFEQHRCLSAGHILHSLNSPGDSLGDSLGEEVRHGV